jgi:hypothetical protein
MRALRAQGYTFEAIRLALASSGVHVSNATVQREVARASESTYSSQGSGADARPEEWPPALTPPLASVSPPTTTAPQSPQVVFMQTDMRSGKEIAEAFASSRITNPLALARLNAKDPS